MALEGQMEYPEKQILPMAPVLCDVAKELLPRADMRDKFLHQDDYFVQPQEWTDAQKIMVYQHALTDARRGRCVTCDRIVAYCDESDTRNDQCVHCTQEGTLDTLDEPMTHTRKGCAQLPPPLMRARAFHFQNVRHAIPDYPQPSEIQGMRLLSEHKKQLRMESALRVRQRMLQKSMQETGTDSTDLADSSRKRARS